MSDHFRFHNMMKEEAVVLTFPFADELLPGVTLTGTPIVNCIVVSGTDATPAAFINTCEINGTNVLVAVDARAATYTGTLCDYELRVVCPTTVTKLVLGRIGRIMVIK